jgi:hypothetical protein
MAKKRQIYFDKVTQQGLEDITCPVCDGDGVFVGDYEDDGKSIDISVCYLCNATGIAEYGKDYDVKVHYEEDKPIFEVIPMSK